MWSSAVSRPSFAASASGRLRLPERTLPSVNAASALKPSFCATASRNLVHAANTPAVELLAPHCPPDPADAGKSESPSFTTILSIGRPIISAAVCAMIV